MVSLHDSLRATFSSAVGATSIPAGTGVFASLFSGAKLARVQRIRISGHVATAAVYGSLIVTKRTAVGSAGTPTEMVEIAHDTNGPAATAVARHYSGGLGTAGTGGGVVAAGIVFLPLTGTPANGVTPYEFRFSDGIEAASLLLRAGEGIELSFSATTTNTATLTIEFLWTEE